MMNKKDTKINRNDMLELTRRMTLSRNCFVRAAGAYIDDEGYIDNTFNVSFKNMSKHDQQVNLDLAKTIRFLYKGIIIKHNKTEPTYTKTSLFLCEKRRFLWPGLRKEGNLFKLAGPGGLAFFHLTKKEVSKWPMKK